MEKSFFAACCRVFSVVALILGLIVSIWLAVQFGVTVEDMIWTDDIVYRDLGKSFLIFFVGAFASFGFFVFWGAIAEQLEKTDYIIRKIDKLETSFNALQEPDIELNDYGDLNKMSL